MRSISPIWDWQLVQPYPSLPTTESTIESCILPEEGLFAWEFSRKMCGSATEFRCIPAPKVSTSTETRVQYCCNLADFQKSNIKNDPRVKRGIFLIQKGCLTPSETAFFMSFKFLLLQWLEVLCTVFAKRTDEIRR